jgi:tetratricopeptide (TPR) repeat protein
MPEREHGDQEVGAPGARGHDARATAGSTRSLGRRSGFFGDPVVRMLAWLTGLLIMAYLATVVGALYFGVLGNPAPRTAVEQRLMVNRSEVEAGSQDPVVWSHYIEALIADGQYGRAETMIDRALAAKYEDPTKQYFGLARARLDLARRRYAEAIKDADAAMASLTEMRDKAVAQFRLDGSPSAMSTGDLGDVYYALLQVKAQALEESGRGPEAIDVLDSYLTSRPRDADILVWRGDLEAAAGDYAAAVADYKEASRYMPGDADLQRKIAETGASR